MYTWYFGIIFFENFLYFSVDLSFKPIFSPSKDWLCEGISNIELLCLDCKIGERDFLRGFVSCFITSLNESEFFMFLNWRLHDKELFSLLYLKLENNDVFKVFYLKIGFMQVLKLFSLTIFISKFFSLVEVFKERLLHMFFLNR